MATDLERFVSAPGRDDLVKDVRQQIDAAGVTYIYYQFISVTGRIMGKVQRPIDAYLPKPGVDYGPSEESAENPQEVGP